MWKTPAQALTGMARPAYHPLPVPANDESRSREARYKGHRTQVTASPAPNGRWMWSYLVDGRSHSVERVPCASAEAAQLQGLNAAKNPCRWV